MELVLRINCGFATNRITEPDVWGKIVGQELGLTSVQFVADLLNPFLPDYFIDSQIRKINAVKEEYGFSIDSIFTSTYTRVNHLASPEKNLREIWLEWFKKLFCIGASLGARMGGSHFGFLTSTYSWLGATPAFVFFLSAFFISTS